MLLIILRGFGVRDLIPHKTQLNISIKYPIPSLHDVFYTFQLSWNKALCQRQTYTPRHGQTHRNRQRDRLTRQYSDRYQFRFLHQVERTEGTWRAKQRIQIWAHSWSSDTKKTWLIDFCVIRHPYIIGDLGLVLMHSGCLYCGENL